MVLTVCGVRAEPLVDLHSIEVGAADLNTESVFKNLPLGLHLIEPQLEDHEILVIATPGATGQENDWIDPLKVIDHDKIATYFYRANAQDCPSKSAKELYHKLQTIMDESEHLSRVVFIGRDSGGAILTQLIPDWKYTIATDVHLVATPLAALKDLYESADCQVEISRRIPPTLRLLHWKVREVKQDNFFADFDYDPQALELKGGLSITMPKAFKNEPITHKTSLRWVAQRIRGSYRDEATEE